MSVVSPRMIMFIVFVLSHAKVGFVQAQNEEASVLLEWKASLDGQSQSALVSWAKDNNPCQSWIGVTCRNGNLSKSEVTHISLGSLGLKGSLLNLNFGSLGHLQELDLHNNSLFGPLPSSLSNVSQLRVLTLSLNHFSGMIPLEIGNLRSLELLYLQSNRLTGNIPYTIGNLTNLVHLYLFQNNLSGTIPKEIGMLPTRKLENLDISSNNLTGEIPSSLGNLTSMYFFYLYDNKLSGTIPAELVGASGLMDLQISNNFLTGSIPASFRNFIRLDRLYLYSNDLTGTFPKDINLSKIRSFSVDSNMLSGSLPQVGELIESFTASDNYFSGHIPETIGNAKSLVELYLSRNRLSGPIPETIGKISSLRYLNLDDNMFHGTLPAVPVNIIAYSIKNNTMTGDLPSSICHSNLEIFHVSDNNITGEIPECFKKGSSLTSLNVNDNRLQGLVPRSLVNCRSLEVLDLGKNMISDTFPSWLASLPQLQVLVLKSNRLYDAIETSSSETDPFNKLRILDLSRNLFTGLLPSKYFEKFQGMMDIDGRPPAPLYMGLSMSLSGQMHGRVLGGNLAGILVAASTIHVIVGSFVPKSQKQSTARGGNETQKMLVAYIMSELHYVFPVIWLTELAITGHITIARRGLSTTESMANNL
ncbi:putative leucine-rich repeat receptor-like protein kinase [Artemisia annua]|uniref:Putative leucine-rich repeat receptor-like protein kinase n=1 Tax=Artemisia annua TaxID=35608 RepID=A0A2U1PN87_ARTAN|nr:putative leucine-rich repeat receptor-like protein kinase [Artemisia annua]